MMRQLLPALLLLFGLGIGDARAHGSSNAYLTLSPSGNELTGQWEIAIRDLDYAIGLDTDGNGAVTWGELRARRVAIEEYAFTRLTLTDGNGQTCPIHPDALLVDHHGDGTYAVLRFGASCAAGARTGLTRVGVRYNLLFDLDPQHRGLLKVQQGDNTRVQVLSPEAPSASFDVGDDSAGAAFTDFFFAGAAHIMGGIDHILFVAVLLFPAIFVRVGRRWTPNDRFWNAFLETVKTLSAFTLAHAITLTAAVTGLVHIPARITDTAVALTIVATAIDNIVPIFRGRRWMLGFGFGLIHGFGYASALGPLHLPPGALATALLGFNIGVETVQILLVALILPLTYTLRFWRGFPLHFVPAASGVAVMLATLWLIDRALNLQLAPI